MTSEYESEETIELYKALFEAKKSFDGVNKTGYNPVLNHHYATVEDIYAAVKKSLEGNKLYIASKIIPIQGHEKSDALLEVKIIHLPSKQFTCSRAYITPQEPPKEEPETEESETSSNYPNKKKKKKFKYANKDQAWGASRTYRLRYILDTILGLASDDLDPDKDIGNNKVVVQKTGCATDKQVVMLKVRLKSYPELQKKVLKQYGSYEKILFKDVNSLVERMNYYDEEKK